MQLMHQVGKSVCRIETLFDGVPFYWFPFPGQIDLNLQTIHDSGIMFYTGNLHKWCFAPRGCAVLWCHPSVRDKIRPLVTSHYTNMGYQEEFYMQVR